VLLKFIYIISLLRSLYIYGGTLKVVKFLCSSHVMNYHECNARKNEVYIDKQYKLTRIKIGELEGLEEYS
jgi:hypothetical protein